MLILIYGRYQYENDFYEWAYSEFLFVNNQRGHLAEYIVAKALNLTSQKG